MSASKDRAAFSFTLAMSVAVGVASFSIGSTASADSRVTPPPSSRATPAPATTSALQAPPVPGAPLKNTLTKASDVIKKQDPPVINQDVMKIANPDNTHVIVSLTKQRAYLYAGDQIAIDTPVSTGKRAGMTPTGNFTVLEKDPNHHSNIFGNFVDGKGRVVRGGISLKIDSAPSGTHYEGAPMLWFMRLTDEGVGMHVGILPGYAASHGCVRMPADIAPQIYAKVKVGTPVEIDP